MSKATPQISVLTANRLTDGVVVFLGNNGDWIEGIGHAVVARSPEEARALEAQGARDTARNVVVDAYLVEVREAADGLVPIRTRERVRVAGPSILGDVPGYSPSPHRSSRWGEGRGERQRQTQASEQGAAPHPNPLPVKNGERESRASAAEAA